MPKFSGVSIYKPSGSVQADRPVADRLRFQGKRPVIRASSHRRVTEDLARLISETLDRVRLAWRRPMRFTTCSSFRAR
jgi:hypothetical protein